MADTDRAAWATFLYELRGKVQQLFATETPFLAEMTGVGDANRVGRFTRDMDANRDVFSDDSVRHTLITSYLPGAGNPGETSVWNVPHLLPSKKINIKLVRFLVPFSVSVDVERDSMNKPNAGAVEQLVDQSRIALGKLENLEALGDGTGLQVDITDGATSLTTTCGVTANFDVLLPGTVWDILTRSTGADPGQGKRRKIASVVESTRVITWDTASQASDGGSGSIVHTSADGIYVPGSWSNGTPGGGTGPGEIVMQGLEQAAAITGTFETLDKAANPSWQGVDGRGGDTTALSLSDQILDAAMRKVRRSGIGAFDFGIGDPAAIDLYKQGKISQVRYEAQEARIPSGFSGIVYQGGDKPFPLIKEPVHKKKAVKLVDKASFQLYGDSKGPTFLDDDGAMFRRFARALPKEADLLDRVQLGVTKCNTIVFINDLVQAA